MKNIHSVDFLFNTKIPKQKLLMESIKQGRMIMRNPKLTCCMAKPTIWALRPALTQISLDIRPTNRINCQHEKAYVLDSHYVHSIEIDQD